MLEECSKLAHFEPLVLLFSILIALSKGKFGLKMSYEEIN